ncbi:hypothetical protein QBC36DRAFT_186286 [Triangularia setosa]|uniref:Uncharacterized protein n=1 Tax=Triangularia setosa TaxID=2587417 RepID=A0AAN6W7S4_9PEZI|nr:hypothetical protein QBC36DRAFT_186286 [Podospora setosa]
MEDWEVGDQQQAQHAFSTAYLSKQVAIPGHQNLSVQVVSISSGTNHMFSADRSSTRICSLTSGKVKVHIKESERGEGAEEFVIGAGGLFVIGAGRKCWVMNRCYIDVRLQVTSCGV